MLKTTLARALRASERALRDPAFWLFLLGLVGAALLLVVLIAYAVERHDTFLRLRPLICEQGVGDRQLFIIAMAAPPWLVFVLATLGELWGLIELRRDGHPAHWFHFWLFLLLASGLGALILFELGC